MPASSEYKVILLIQQALLIVAKDVSNCGGISKKELFECCNIRRHAIIKRAILESTVPCIWDRFSEKGANAYIIKFPLR